MHEHGCPHCKQRFMCPDSIIDCFRGEADCDSCFWRVTVPRFLIGSFLLLLAIGMTVALFGTHFDR